MSSSSSKPSAGAPSRVEALRRRCAARSRARRARRSRAASASGAPRRGHVDLRRVLAVGAGIGRLEVDDVAQQDLGFVELVAPDDDRLEGQRALAQARDHRLAAGLDALGDGDFALARQQLDRAHLAQIHAHRIVGAVGRLARCGWRRPSRAAPRRVRRPRPPPPRRRRPSASSASSASSALDDVDAHLVEHRDDVLDLVGGDLLGGQHRVQLVIGDEAALLGGLDHAA